MSIARQQAVVNCRTISYLETGQGEPVLLLHAFPLSAAMWEPQLAAVPDGWRFIAPDFRGFGMSRSAPSGDTGERGRTSDAVTSVDDYAADVLGLLDALGIQQAVIGGLSMGGYVSFAVLRKALHRARGLILADTRAAADTGAARVARDEMRALLRREGPRAVARELVPRLLSDETLRERPAVAKRVRELIEATSAEAIDGALVALKERPDAGPILGTIDVPTLILVGEQDRLTPVADGEDLHRRIRDTRLAILPGAGHLTNLEQSEAFNGALGSFLDDRL